MDEIFDKLQSVVDRYDELNELISDPEVIADTQKFMKLSKEEADLRDTVAAFKKYQKVNKQLDDDKEMLREKKKLMTLILRPWLKMRFPV